jgi:H+/Cl- antiporter ClcA
VDSPDPTSKAEEQDPGDQIANAIVQGLLLFGVFLLLSSLLIPAFTDWHPPEFAVWILAAVVAGLVGRMFQSRREERPYERELEELRKEAAEPNLPEPVPPRSE